MAYYGSTPINQGAAGLGIVAPRAREAVRSKDLLAIVAPPFAGLGQDAVVADPVPLVTSDPTPSTVTVVAVEEPPSKWHAMGGILSLVGAAGGAYHGYKRNQSAGWALGWFIFGSALPIFALPVALAQGFAKPKRA